MQDLEQFIVKAKANGWVAAEPGGKKISSSRPCSLDIVFEQGDFYYQDSFVGLTDFCGQEHVCLKGEAVWSQAYYGYLVRPDLISGSQVIEILRSALESLYKQNRFLGKFEHQHNRYLYRDNNNGNFQNFQGEEEILIDGVVAYRLRYFGGLVKA